MRVIRATRVSRWEFLRQGSIAIIEGKIRRRTGTPRIRDARPRREAGRETGDFAADVKKLRKEKAIDRGMTVSRSFVSACEVAARKS